MAAQKQKMTWMRYMTKKKPKVMARSRMVALYSRMYHRNIASGVAVTR